MEPGVFKYEVDGKIFYRVRFAKRSTKNPSIFVDRTKKGVNSYQEARKEKKKLERQVYEIIAKREREQRSWGTLVEGWSLAASQKDILTKDVTKGTIEEYVAILRNYTREWWLRPANEIGMREAWGLLDQVDRDFSRSRRVRLRTAIDTVFKWAILAKKIDSSIQIPTQGFKSNRREEENLPEILNQAQVQTFLKAALAYEHPWYPIWAFALFTGMRSGELYALEWDQVDLDNDLIFVHRNWTNKEGFGPTKGRYWRTVPIDRSDVKQFLTELRLKGGKEKSVLPRYQAWKDGRQAEILRTFLEGVGLPSVKFHTLRACFATTLIANGVPPAAIMAICGWKDLKTMQRYIRLAGIDVRGATQKLEILPTREVMGKVVTMFKTE